MKKHEPTYGKSPLIAYMEVLHRQKIAHEFIRNMSRTCLAALKKKPIQDVKIAGYEILPISDKPLEWLPMGVDINYIFAAYGIPENLIGEHTPTTMLKENPFKP